MGQQVASFNVHALRVKIEWREERVKLMTKQRRELHLVHLGTQMQRLTNILIKLVGERQPQPQKLGHLQLQQKLQPQLPTVPPYPEPIEDFEKESMEVTH